MLSLYVQKYLHRYDARLSKQHVFDNKYCGKPSGERRYATPRGRKRWKRADKNPSTSKDWKTKV